MRTRVSGPVKRFLVFLLCLAMILPTSLIGETQAYAANDTMTRTLRRLGTEQSVFISDESNYLLVGETYNLEMGRFFGERTYRYRSDNEASLVVSQNGVVTAKAPGKAVITCIYKSGKKTVTLSAEFVAVEKTELAATTLAFEKIEKVIVPGDKYQLLVNTKPAKSDDMIFWSSSNPKVATVDDEGVIHAIKPGTTRIYACSLQGKADASIVIRVYKTLKITNQKELDQALNNPNTTNLYIETDKEVTFTIKKGDYSKKNLHVNAPNATVIVNGSFHQVNVQEVSDGAITINAAPELAFLAGNKTKAVIGKGLSCKLKLCCPNASVIIENLGKVQVDIAAASNYLQFIGTDSVLDNTITVRRNDATINLFSPVNLSAERKFDVMLASGNASKSRLIVKDKNAIPKVEGKFKVDVLVNGTKYIYEGSGEVKKEPIPVFIEPESSYLKAYYGTPYVDGVIDECWKDAAELKPVNISADTETEASYRLMWNDFALFVLAEVKDSNLDASAAAAYEQDSLEIFLDELYDRASTYQSDDAHYRANFNNVRSTDSGDAGRFYSGAQILKDAEGNATGYIVEASILWSENFKPNNKVLIGADLQINEAANGSRAATMNIFDKTGNAYQDPSLLGTIELKGKTQGSVSGTNPYRLFALIDSVNNTYLDQYVNKDVITTPLANAVSVANNKFSTQSQIDSAYAALISAVNTLDDGSGYTKPSALPVQTALPDVFTFLDGSQVTTTADWSERQDEILSMYEYYMYGMIRDGSEEELSLNFVDSYKAKMVWGSFVWEYDVTAGPDQKLMEITIQRGTESTKFYATVTLPSETTEGAEPVTTIIPSTREGGYPVLISIGSMGATQRKIMNDGGYAVIEFNTGDIASDDSKHTGAFYELYPYGQDYREQTGVLAAWGWGVSKIIDALEADAAGSQETGISPVNTIVTGISRNGKAAAVAGAFDERIKVTAPGCSGAGGMAAFRYASAGKQYDYSYLPKQEFISNNGEADGVAAWESYQSKELQAVGANEPLSNIQGGSEGHWFNERFKEFSSVNQLPFDQHFLPAICADPDRYFFIIGEVVGGDWTNPAAMYTSYLAARNMYDNLGIGDNAAVHLHAQGHAFTTEDAQYLMEFCNKNFYNDTPSIDLSILQTSIYEEPENYDPYFDTIKNAEGPMLDLKKGISSIPGKVTAVFGTPYVDGVIDECWANAPEIVPSIHSASTDTTVTFRALWDDNGLYTLAVVKDASLDKASANSYEEDSFELFLDEYANRTTAYEADDVHFRVNFDNERSADNGLLERFFTRTSLTYDDNGDVDGYIVETCTTWLDDFEAVNGKVVGAELQINEAAGGSRKATLNVFDTTGNAYQNTGLFGNLVLNKKPENGVSGANPYTLMAFIENVKAMNTTIYVNADVLTGPLDAAETVAENQNATQAEIDTAAANLQAAIELLDDGSGFVKPNLLPLNTELPDVFTFADGSAVLTKQDWYDRRQEILDLYQYYVYGVIRDGSEEDLTVDVIDSYEKVNSWFGYTWTDTVKAADDQKFIKIQIDRNEAQIDFIATATFPSVQGIIVTGAALEAIPEMERQYDVNGNAFVATSSALAKKLVVPSEHENGYPSLIVIGSLGATEKAVLNNNGYVVIEFNTGDIAADDSSRTGAFYDIYPYGDSWTEQTGVLAAWGWGVSKVIDAIEYDAINGNVMKISPVDTMVTGISRNGKAAAVAGAYDDRIKVVIPGCSGAGGTASFYFKSTDKQYDYSYLPLQEFISNQGETAGTASWTSYQDKHLETVTANEPISALQSNDEGHWFNDNFKKFTSQSQLPLDQYFLAAICADPDRYYFITGEVVGGDWTNAAAMYATYLASKSMYESLGIEDHIAVHLHSVGHTFTKEDAQYVVAFANKHLYGIEPSIDLAPISTSIYEQPENKTDDQEPYRHVGDGITISLE